MEGQLHGVPIAVKELFDVENLPATLARAGGSAGVEDEHAGRQHEPVHGERQQTGGEAGLAVSGDALVGVPVADHSPHRREGDHGQDGGGSDETVSDGWGLDAPAGDRGAAQRDICRVSR